MSNNQYTMQQINSYCEKHQIAISPQQKLILEIIANTNIPLTSSDILNQLIIKNSTANRMTIYRALDYLIRFQLIHKIQSQNTYTTCKHVSDHKCQILVCQKCGQQVEIHSHDVCNVLDKIQEENNFVIANPLEILGLCIKCR